MAGSFHHEESGKHTEGVGRRKRRRTLPVLSAVCLCLLTSINPLLTTTISFCFEYPEAEIPVRRARFWGKYIPFWMGFSRDRMTKRNAAFLSLWLLCRSVAFTKDHLQGFKNGGLKSCASKAQLLQLNNWVIYIGMCFIYEAVAVV